MGFQGFPGPVRTLLKHWKLLTNRIGYAVKTTIYEKNMKTKYLSVTNPIILFYTNICTVHLDLTRACCVYEKEGGMEHCLGKMQQTID